ncbi:histone H1 gamma protein [Echinococcus multilocularis]|uniref:Histone H1 gamma protein n=1 Tax=Echinococcus multilocularis TaxID=6211 RepID=U6HRD8_ECHMU|nr:histone H1 gamma protein [Echinococcus multilocularis]CDS37720.1 histone H1 gamma protein [Echinococcus multilocularis]
MSASAPKAKKSKAPASHPPVLEMIKDAIACSKDRKGASLAVIKKHVTTHYKVDMTRIAPHLRRAIVHGVENGALVRVGNKGTGASGSFKLANKFAEKRVPRTARAKKAVSAKVVKKRVPSGTVSKKAEGAPKAKVSAPEVVKGRKATAGVKANEVVPKSPAKAAGPKSPKKAAGPKQKTPVKKSKGMAPKTKKQAAKKAARS